MQQLVSGLSADRDSIGNSVTTLDAATGDIADLLVDARPNLQSALANLDASAAQIDAGRPKLESVLDRLPDNYRRMVRTGIYGSFFQFYMCGLDIKFDGLNGSPITAQLIRQESGRCRVVRRTETGSAIRMGGIGIVMCALVVLAGLQIDRLPLLTVKASYSASFTEAGGLGAGDTVLVAGVAVGKVTKVSLDRGLADVRLEVDPGVVLGSQTTAEIKTNSLLGRRGVVLTTEGDGRLKTGDRSADRTNSPYSLNDALGGVTSQISQIDTDSVSDSLDSLSGVLQQVNPELGGTLDGLTRLSETINSRDEGVQQLLDRANQVTTVLADRSKQIDSLLVDGNNLFAELASRRDAVQQLIDNVSSLSVQLSGTVADNEAVMPPLVEKLNRVVALLQSKKDKIAESLKGLSVYTGELSDTVASGPFYYAYVQNLVPAQYLQPILNAAAGLPPAPLPLPVIK